MSKTTCIVLAIICMAWAGCERGASSNNGQVAVVDLDAVARKLGKDKQILSMIEQRQLSLNQRVSSAQQSLIDQLNQKKNEFGELDDEESKQLAQMQTRANAILNSTRTQAQSDLTAFQQEVVDRFRAETKPVALAIAAKKGCRVVLSKNDSVIFAFDQTIDLTDEVVAAMRAQSSVSSETKPDDAHARQAKTNQNAVPKS